MRSGDQSGHNYVPGQHTLQITEKQGLEVFRRVQASQQSNVAQPTPSAKRSVTGVEAIDILIGGEPPNRAPTALQSPSQGVQKCSPHNSRFFDGPAWRLPDSFRTKNDRMSCSLVSSHFTHSGLYCTYNLVSSPQTEQFAICCELLSDGALEYTEYR